jgi:peptidoglycan/LPS O-acetylase OafA/YrhL
VRNDLFDGLRGVAALGVLLYHVGVTYRSPYLVSGYLAVDFFFLLSGFVIWNAYGDRLRQGMPLLMFAARRCIRLYPLYLLGMLLGVLQTLITALPVTDTESLIVSLPLSIVLHVSMLPMTISSGSVFPLNDPAWSLSLEVAVNVMLCLWLARASDRLLALICAMAGLSVVFAAVHFGSLDIGWNQENYLGGVARCIFSFILGTLSARRGPVFSMTRDVNGIAAAGIMLAFLSLMIVDPGPSFRPTFDIICVLGIFPLTLMVAATITLEGAVAKAGRWLGSISYPLYATHFPILLLLKMLLPRLDLGPLAECLTSVTVCISCAVVLIPVDQLLQRKMAARRGPNRSVSALSGA